MGRRNIYTEMSIHVVPNQDEFISSVENHWRCLAECPSYTFLMKLER